MALEPTVCESLGICRPCACNSFTQWRLTFDDESRSSETLLSGHDESNLVFYEIVGDMVFGRRTRVRPDPHISHMALSNGPATSGHGIPRTSFQLWRYTPACQPPKAA